MPKLTDLLERVQDFLAYQEEVYGSFSVQLPQESSVSKEFTAPRVAHQLESLTIHDAEAIKGSVTNGRYNYLEAWISAGYPFPEEVTGLELFDRLRKCSSLDELQTICTEADILKTDLPDTKLVFGVGNPDADLVVIGEAPGADEDLQGEPFVGRSGQLLTKILEAIKVNRKDIYIANIVKHRPPDNATPTPHMRAIGLPFLLKQLEFINPKLLLCAGRTAALALINQNLSLADMRSKAFPFGPSCELYVTYHPAALLRDPNYKRPTWEDVQLIRKRYDELGCKPVLAPMDK